MAENTTKHSDNQQHTHHIEHATNGPESAQAGQGVGSYSASLLNDSRLDGRGNEPVRIALMRQMQQSYGNRAVQRFVQGGQSGEPSGNRAVQRFLQRTREVTASPVMVATLTSSSVQVQRCGGEIHDGCACAGEAAGVQRQAAEDAGPAPSDQGATGQVPSDVVTETNGGGAATTGGGGTATPTAGCSVTGSFSTIPSGNLAATMSGNRLGGSFTMISNFVASSGSGCTCSCGEYRQYVWGTFTANGNPVVHSLGGGRNLHPTTPQEDGDVGAGTVYGHRSVLGTQSRFLPNQATGCRFEGADQPGIASATSGTVLAMNLGFRGDLIDTCNSNNVIATSSWSVRGTGTVR
jgi:hypothetical protein